MASPLSPERLAEIRKMVEDGAPHREIARTLNVARTTLNKYFPEYKGWSKQQNAEMSQATRRYNIVMKSNGVNSTLVLK